MATTGHQSPQSSFPPLKVKQLNTTTWGAGGNTTTIKDSYISPNSFIDCYVTGTSVQASGQWSYTVTAGQVVITSSASEQSTLPLTYIVL
jgi:hypothetical protein